LPPRPKIAARRAPLLTLPPLPQPCIQLAPPRLPGYLAGVKSNVLRSRLQTNMRPGRPGTVAARSGKEDKRTACERSHALGDGGPSGPALGFAPAGSSWPPDSRTRRSADRRPRSPVARADSHSAAAVLPLSRGQAKPNPKPSGRKAGEKYGWLHCRPFPLQVDERTVVLCRRGVPAVGVR